MLKDALTPILFVVLLVLGGVGWYLLARRNARKGKLASCMPFFAPPAKKLRRNH